MLRVTPHPTLCWCMHCRRILPHARPKAICRVHLSRLGDLFLDSQIGWRLHCLWCFSFPQSLGQHRGRITCMAIARDSTLVTVQILSLDFTLRLVASCVSGQRRLHAACLGLGFAGIEFQFIAGCTGQCGTEAFEIKTEVRPSDFDRVIVVDFVLGMCFAGTLRQSHT